MPIDCSDCLTLATPQLTTTSTLQAGVAIASLSLPVADHTPDPTSTSIRIDRKLAPSSFFFNQAAHVREGDILIWPSLMSEPSRWVDVTNGQNQGVLEMFAADSFNSSLLPKTPAYQGLSDYLFAILKEATLTHDLNTRRTTVAKLDQPHSLDVDGIRRR